VSGEGGGRSGQEMSQVTDSGSIRRSAEEEASRSSLEMVFFDVLCYVRVGLLPEKMAK